MSNEALRIKNFIDEVTDKSGHENDYLVLDGVVVSKIKLSTLLAGILAPDGLGNIDAGSNNIININNIIATSAQIGSITAPVDFVGIAKNNIMPRSVVTQDLIVGYTDVNSKIMSVTSGLFGYVSIPDNKVDSNLIMSAKSNGITVPALTTVTIVVTVSVYDSDTSGSTIINTLYSTSLVNSTGSAVVSNITPFTGMDYIETQTLTATQEIRIRSTVTNSPAYEMSYNFQLIE